MLQLSNLELYKNKITEILDNEFVYAEEWELLEDPLLIPVYVDPNGQKTLTKQSGLHAATEARNFLHVHQSGFSSMIKVNFESLVFPNLESVPTVPKDNGPFYYSLYRCPEIKNLYFPELKSLGNCGMRYFVNTCPNLCKMEFPKLESIGQYAFETNFQSCPKLQDIYFPSLVSAKSHAFSNCGTGVKFHFKKSLANDSNFSSNHLSIPTSQIVFDI